MLETCEPYEVWSSSTKPEILRRSRSNYSSLSSSHSISSICPKLLNKKSFAYHRMPQQPFNLSVIIKLDGSTFDVQVSRMATVAKLIEAVKDVFDQSANDDDQISWSNVWGHFCLCYNDKKLLDYKACIRAIGIKDGDELRFVRHLSARRLRPSKIKGYEKFIYRYIRNKWSI